MWGSARSHADRTVTTEVAPVSVPEPLSSYLPGDGEHRRFVQYLLVGLVGIGINQGVLYLAAGVVGLSYVVGGILGRVLSVAANYAMNDAWTWGDRGASGRREWLVRGGKYVATRVVGVAIGTAALILFVEVLDLHYLLANLLAIGVGVLWGFGASEHWVWQPDDEGESLDHVGSHRAARADGAGPDGRIRAAVWRVRKRIGSRTEQAVGGGRSSVVSWPVRRLLAVDRPTWLVVGLAAVLFAVFSTYTSLLYEAYVLTGSDFGSYVHMFSTTLDGQGLLVHGKYRVSHPGGSYFGAHFSLTLLAFVPLFALVPSPFTLLVAKSFLLASSVVALWAVARHHLDSDRLAGLLVVSYALNPFLWGAWLFDFQEQVLLPILVFGGYLAYVKRRYAWFLVAMVLVMLTNEFVIYVVLGAFVGLGVAAYREGRLRRESPLLAVGVAWAVGVKLVGGAVMARFSEFSGIPYSSIATPLQSYVPEGRASTGQLLATMVEHPEVIFALVSNDAMTKFLYFVAFLLPVAFLALEDEITVGAFLPFLGFAWLLAGRPVYYTFGAHYPLYLLPFLYIGAVRVIGRTAITPPSRDLLARLFAIVIVVSVVGGVATALDRGAFPIVDDHTETLDATIDTIPEDASLVTQNDIYPHVAERPNANYVVRPDTFQEYQRLYGTVSPEYILYDTQLKGSSFWAERLQEAFGDRLYEEYGVYRYQDGIYVLKRGYSGPVRSVTESGGVDRRYAADQFALSEGATLTDGTIVTDGVGSGNVWFGPYTQLPPGQYTATYHVNVSGANGSGVVLNVAASEDHEVLVRERVGPTDGWTTVALNFTLDRTTGDVEFRGARTGDSGTVRFESVVVERTGDGSVDETNASNADAQRQSRIGALSTPVHGPDAHSGRSSTSALASASELRSTSLVSPPTTLHRLRP